MLYIKLICVGKMRERFYLDAFAEYRKRLQAYCRLELCEIGEQRLPDAPSEKEIAAALEKEAEEIVRAIPPDAYAVALCVEGKQMPSEGMAALLAERESSGKPKLCFIVGGSCGLAESVSSLIYLAMKSPTDMRKSSECMKMVVFNGRR